MSLLLYWLWKPPDYVSSMHKELKDGGHTNLKIFINQYYCSLKSLGDSDNIGTSILDISLFKCIVLVMGASCDF